VKRVWFWFLVILLFCTPSVAFAEGTAPLNGSVTTVFSSTNSDYTEWWSLEIPQDGTLTITVTPPSVGIVIPAESWTPVPGSRSILMGGPGVGKTPAKLDIGVQNDKYEGPVTVNISFNGNALTYTSDEEQRDNLNIPVNGHLGQVEEGHIGLYHYYDNLGSDNWDTYVYDLPSDGTLECTLQTADEMMDKSPGGIWAVINKDWYNEYLEVKNAGENNVTLYKKIDLPKGKHSVTISRQGWNYGSYALTTNFIPKGLSSLKNTEVKSDKAVISWEPITGVIGYNIYRSETSGSYGTIPVTDFAVTETSYTDDKVTPGGKYYYIVKPVMSGNVEGAASNEITVSIPLVQKKTIVLQINNPKMSVNGLEQDIDPGYGTKPVISSGRTLLPVRAVIEQAGGTISWSGTEKKVTISCKGKTIEMWIGNKQYTVDGVKKTMDVPPAVIGGRTMMPIRYIADALGFVTKWDSITKKVTIEL
jgi:hypothetical protein